MSTTGRPYTANDPAFPSVFEHDGQRHIIPGVSAATYLAAHAPAEPQPWFEPVMPKHPTRPVRPWSSASELTDAERCEEADLDSFSITADEMKEPRVRDYYVAMQAWEEARQDWAREQTKQRYVQWPLAWAREILKTLEIDQ